MMNNMINKVVLILSLLLSVSSAFADERQYLNSGFVEWSVRPADGSEWIPATVPGTFFVDFVNAGLEDTPEFADNIYKVDRVKYNKRHIYKAEFKIDSELRKKSKRVWLNFEGINRWGTVRLNGIDLGKLSGFMQRGCYDVTDILTNLNVLEVAVDVPNQHRHPEEKFANMASPSYLSSAGWDWMPNVPGLNSGITDDVFLSFSDDITIMDPWIRTRLEDSGAVGDISICIDMKNHCGKKLNAAVRCRISPGNINIEKPVSLDSEVSKITLDSDEFPVLKIKNPSLWWPNGMGDQPLYTCSIEVINNGKVSDSKEIKFGIREYDYKIDENGCFNIYVNGKRTFVKGGNWGMSEYLLRCRGDEYYIKVRLHKEMNFNIIRNWMGSVTDEEFYDACDKYGILVWDDFWLNSKIGLPEFSEEFNLNAIEKIKRLRNHPSIVVWCGENEGTPGTYENGESLDKNLASYVAEFDGGDRHYQSDSRKGNGLSGSGLWKNYPPEFYFERADNSRFGDSYPSDRGWGFRSEIGTAVFTTFDSFKKFIPEKYWWPQNDMWNKHFFGKLAKNGGPEVYSKTIETKYGTTSGIGEFCEKAQLVNMETNKAMFEAWACKLWNDASGIMIWMSQPAYPSFVWQTYDYYYDLTGAYWGAKKACEPVHILWNSHTNEVYATNTTLDDCNGMTAYAMIYDRNGTQVREFRKEMKIDIPANKSVKCFDILADSTGTRKLTDVNFLRLTLRGPDGKVVSRNDYWFGKNRSDCSGLNTLEEAELAFYISRREVKDGKYYLDFKITNKDDIPAFFVGCWPYDKNNSKQIAPVFQNDNYITLMPGEIKVITFEFDDSPYYDNSNVFVKVKQYGHPEQIVE